MNDGCSLVLKIMIDSQVTTAVCSTEMIKFTKEKA